MGIPGVVCEGIDVAGRRGRQEALLEVKAHAVYSCEWRGTEECTLWQQYLRMEVTALEGD